MKNRWILMNKENMQECEELLNREDLKKVLIDGSKTNTKNSFMDQVGKALQFPTLCEGKFSRLEDWIRDLSWFPAELGVCIRITDYQEFLKDDPKSKKIIEEVFREEVLPFWETKVSTQVKGGNPREFYVIIS